MPGFNANFRNTGAQALNSFNGAANFVGNGNPIQLHPFVEPVINLHCGDDVMSELTPQSEHPFERGENLVDSLRYHARFFNFEIDIPRHVRISVISTNFTPFISFYRRADVMLKNVGGSVETDVTSDTTGPWTLEVSSVEPYATGDFEVKVDCSVPPNKLIYWSFDLNVFGTFRDNSLNIPLVPGFEGIITVPGVQGNAVQFSDGNATLQSFLQGQPQLPKYDGASGFSVAFWVNLALVTGTSNSLELLRLTLNGDDGHQYQLAWEVPPFVTFPPIIFDNAPLRLIKDPNVATNIVAQVPVPITWVVGDWYFVVLLYNGNIQASVNAGMLSTSAGSFTLPSGTWDTLNLSPLIVAQPAGLFNIDEYLIHTGLVLTQTQINNLYNSGLGVTWPQAGVIVSS